MSMQTASKQAEALVQRMNKYIARALIFFSTAWFFLTVGVFTVNPVGPSGIASLCIGLPCAIIGIFYFIRYGLISRKIYHLLSEQ
jgi:hypothetical protein